MSKKTFLILIFLGSTALANSLNLKLPGKEGENFIVTRGYGTVTHRGVDSFALDFALNGCRTFGQPVLAAEKGVVVRMENWHKRGEKNSYGNMVVIDHSENIFSLYGHMNTINVKIGDVIKQGEQIGTIGNTGSCEGTACHPYEGAHLHFAMYQKEKYIDANGREKQRLVPYKPEPMSGFSVFVAGKYYKSDNGLLEKQEGGAVELASKADESGKAVAQKPKSDDFCRLSDIGIGNNIAPDGKDRSKLTVETSSGSIEHVRDDNGANFKIDENGKVVRIENAAGNGSVDSASAKKKELSFEEKYNAKLSGREIAGVREEAGHYVVSPGGEIGIGLNYKNTGVWDWSNKNVSLNITDPGMSVFYDGWLTKKRPAAVSQNSVKPGGEGNFSFRIRVPKTLGFYKFGVRPVVFYENDFHWFGDGGDFWEIEVRAENKNENNADAGGNVAEAGASAAGDLGVGGNPDEGAEKPENQKDKNEEMDQGEESDKDRDKNKDKRIFGGGSDGMSLESEIETYLSSYPPEHTNAEQAIFSFNSNLAEAKFKCRLDAGSFAECSSSLIYGNLAEGGHVFEVKAFAGGKEDATPATHSFETDRTAPLAVRDLEADSPEKGSVFLSGTLPEEGLSKIRTYYKKLEDCSKEGRENVESWSAGEILLEEDAKEKSGNRFELSLKGLEEGENYCFAVKTEDLAGNVSALSNISEAIINNLTDHIVISEINLHGENRFLELYNPTGKDEDLSGYSLQFLEEGAGKTVKIDFAEGSSISSHGFFLVADENFLGDLAPDLSGTLPEASGKAATYLAKTAGYLLDKENGMENINAAAIADQAEAIAFADANWSLERKAHPNSTSELMLAVPHKYDGNGYDSGRADDFVVRLIPQPQNSASTKEPHKSQKPVIKTPAWNGGEYFTGESVSLKIEIDDLEDGALFGDSIVWQMDGAEAGRGTEINITKWVAGKYDLSIEAVDSDGEKTSETFSIEVADNGWSEPVEVPDADTEIYGADIDEKGVLHIAYFQESCDEEGNCISSIYYQKKEGNSFSEPAEIIRINDPDYYAIIKVNVQVDGRGVVHVFYVEENREGPLHYHNYHAYYANSSDSFKSTRLIFEDIHYAKFQVDSGSLYFTAIDYDAEIYYKKFSISGSSIGLVGESSYKMDAGLITSYDFSVKDGRLYFIVLYEKENADYAPKQFTEGLPISLALGIIEHLWVGYLEAGDAGWSLDVLGGDFPAGTSVYISGGSPSYMLADDSIARLSSLFAKQGNAWYRDEMDVGRESKADADYEWGYVCGFGRNADGKLHSVSFVESYSFDTLFNDIFWNLYDGNISRKISLFPRPSSEISLGNITYVSNASGKEGILFSYYDVQEGEPHRLYYIERN